MPDIFITYPTFQLISITGVVDGSNSIFTCSSTPLQVFNSGRLMYLTDDYTLSGIDNNIVTFNAGKQPFVGDILKTFGNI